MVNYDEQRRHQVISILEDLGLNAQHLDRISSREHNHSFDAPYHNVQHLFTVTINAYELAQYYRLPLNQIKCLVIASLYHDVNHSQGEYYDAINIARAVEAMLNSLKELEESFTHADIDFIAKLIYATEYPHNSIVLTQAEKIIRDSDIMQNAEPDFERWFEGLSVETKTAINLHTTKSFLKSTNVYTHKARKKLVQVGLLDKEW